MKTHPRKPILSFAPSPLGKPQGIFERANSSLPGHKENAKGQKNRAKTPPRGNYFQESSKSHET